MKSEKIIGIIAGVLIALIAQVLEVGGFESPGYWVFIVSMAALFALAGA